MQSILEIANSQFGSAVGGGVIGALAGAIPTWLLARRASSEVLACDAAQRLSDERGKAFRLLTVFSLIANSLFTLRGMMADMLARDVDEGEPTPNQRKISTVVGFSFEMTERFNADDLAILAESSDAGLATEFGRLASSHAAICSALGTYQALKIKNHDLMSEGAEHEIQGEVIRTLIRDPKLAAKIRITDAQLESMIVQILRMIDEDGVAAVALASRFNEAMSKRFSFGNKPNLDLSEVFERFPELCPQPHSQ